MRFAAYAGASTALAGAVIFHAFNQRPNFFSAIIYLSQSQACRMILLNLLALSAYILIRSLQKALYGPLRAIEREQLWDKSWYAITETALAMTTFRDEVGVYFLVMFVSLLAGKIWAWISEGRVEMLEQQPPANPKLFHTRMVASLVIAELFELLMLRYCVNTLISQPRPGMMVMFAFEFAVLFVTSSSTTIRYVLSLQEMAVKIKQTRAKVEERKEEIRVARQESERQRAEGNEQTPAVLEREEDIDENDFDVPGWEGKGTWILFLDLFTDFMKLTLYIGFFTMLVLFHGIPIHIIRDVYLTTRSFIKRINDFNKYRNATKDMNSRYPDATTQDLERDGTCIICREDMRPWEQPPQPPANGAAARPRATAPPDERQRAKKLPCGHVLHLGCLKSWLERQQVCPTCRTSVLTQNQTRGGPGANQAGGLQANGVQAGEAAGNNGGAAGQPNNNQQQPGHQGVRARQFRLGPWRFTFAAGEPGQIRDTLRQLNRPQGAQDRNQAGGNGSSSDRTRIRRQRSSREPRVDPNNIPGQIAGMEQHLVREIQNMHSSLQQLQRVRQLQAELDSLRRHQTGNTGQRANTDGRTSTSAPPNRESPIPLHMPPPIPQQQVPFQMAPMQTAYPHQQVSDQSRAYTTTQTVLGHGHPSLPPGVTLPEGWSLLPLQRHDQGGQQSQTQPWRGLQLPHVYTAADLQQTAPSGSDQPPTSTTSDSAPAQGSQTFTATPTTNAPRADPTPAPEASLNIDPSNIPGLTVLGEDQPLESNKTVNRIINGEPTDPPAEAGPSSANVVPDTANGHAISSTDQSKGKGRAARVEDTDESEAADAGPMHQASEDPS